MAAEDFEQPAARIGAVVKAKPALLEENVAAHFAAQRRIEFLHARLDERMPRFVHHRPPARRHNGWGQLLRAFHVEHDGAAGHAGQHILCKQHHLPVGVDHIAVLGDDAQAIAVAIKGQTELGISFAQDAPDIFEVFQFARVGMVVGKVAIDGAEQFDDFAAGGAEDGGGRSACHAVAAIDHDFQGTREPDVAHDVLPIGGQYIGCLHAAAGLWLPAFAFDSLAQRLDVVAVDGSALQHHLEAVVVLGIVAAGNLDTAVAQRVRGKVKHGRGRQADVDHLRAGVHQTGNQRGGQFRPAQTSVTPHGYGAAAQLQGAGAKGAANRACHFRRECGRNHAADVVGLE